MESRRARAQQGLELNMTPMIDVVFQLIIFFMLVMDMAQADLETLTLPEASEATPHDPGEGLIVLNVVEEGRVTVHGRDLSPERLEVYLCREADLDRNERDRRISNRTVLVRADRAAQYKTVQFILQACARAGLYKISIATREEGAVEPKGS